MRCLGNDGIFNPNSKWLLYGSWFNLDNLTVIFSPLVHRFRPVIIFYQLLTQFPDAEARSYIADHMQRAPVSTMTELWFSWLDIWKIQDSKGLSDLPGASGQVSCWARIQIQVCKLTKLMLFPHNTHCLQLVRSDLLSLNEERAGKENGDTEGESGSSVFRDQTSQKRSRWQLGDSSQEKKCKESKQRLSGAAATGQDRSWGNRQCVSSRCAYKEEQGRISWKLDAQHERDRTLLPRQWTAPRPDAFSLLTLVAPILRIAGLKPSRWGKWETADGLVHVGTGSRPSSLAKAFPWQVARGEPVPNQTELDENSEDEKQTLCHPFRISTCRGKRLLSWTLVGRRQPSQPRTDT